MAAFKKYKINYDLDDPRATLAHRDIILAKPFLKRLYMKWYGELMREVGNGAAIVEIGSGGGFLKSIYPTVITSDILELPGVDKVFSAERMPFADGTLDGIVMLNVFHHIPQPGNFLREAQRILKRGGKVVMIEPANSLLSRFVYKRFHHEPFDEHGGRSIEAGKPLSHSNQALPYIYFERDRTLFAREFPLLSIRKIRYHTPFLYAVSGGVSRDALVPSQLFGAVELGEWLLKPFSRQLALFCTVVLEKT